MKRSKIRALLYLITLLLAFFTTMEVSAEELSLSVEGPFIRLTLLDEEENKNSCSGVLISKKKILTAAHCFDEFIFDGYVEFRGEKVAIDRIIIHPRLRELNTGELLNDLAVAELEHPLLAKFTTHFSSTSPPIGARVTLYGFGTGSKDSFRGGRIRALKVALSSVDDNFLRARYQGESPCYGDSGGAVTWNEGDGEILVGIISSGTIEECGPGDTSISINLQSRDSKQFLKAVLSSDRTKEPGLDPEFRSLRPLRLKQGSFKR